MLILETTAQFRHDYKLMKKRGCERELIETVLDKLLNGCPLEAAHRDHALTGNYAGFRECHIKPDWLLVYKIERDRLVLVAQRTGTHSDLF